MKPISPNDIVDNYKNQKKLENDAKRKELAFARAEEERLAAVNADERKKLSRSNSDILAAVKKWCNNSAAAEAKYGHISKWNTSTVTTMKELFKENNKFNHDISNWDVSNVTNMSYMFYNNSAFTGDISKWNVSNVTNMDSMFSDNSVFTGDISKWNVSNVTNMSGMFSWNSAFTGDISKWNVRNVAYSDSMFDDSKIPNQHKPKKMQK